MNSREEKPIESCELSDFWLKKGVDSFEEGSLKAAIKELTLSASLGSAEACSYLHLIYVSEELFLDTELARAYKGQYLWRLKHLSEDGDRGAKFSLARIIYFGDEGLPSNPGLAIKLITDLAEENYAEAQLYLVEVYRDGMDMIPPDKNKEEYWVRRVEGLKNKSEK